MSAIHNYHKINIAFEKAVTQLQENLQYLADEAKVSDKFISMQNSIIKALINYQHQTEDLISHLDFEILELTKGKISEIEQLKDIKESFEALCIIHGIMDFPMWMKRSKNHLVQQAINDYKENTITLPIALKEMFDRLTQEEQELLNNMLHKKYHQRITELENKIKNYNQKKQ